MPFIYTVGLYAQEFTNGETILDNDDTPYVYEAKTSLFIKQDEPNKRYHYQNSDFILSEGYKPDGTTPDVQSSYDKNTFLALNVKDTDLEKLRGKNILIFDDIVDDLLFKFQKGHMQEIFEKIGATITYGRNPDDVKKEIENKRFDLIYLDLNVDQSSKTTEGLIKSIRSKDTNTPIVALTGLRGAEIKCSSLWNTGFSGFFN
ncbi:MAG: response regulator, partial [Pseudomonadota bacterium]